MKFPAPESDQIDTEYVLCTDQYRPGSVCVGETHHDSCGQTTCVGAGKVQCDMTEGTDKYEFLSVGWRRR